MKVSLPATQPVGPISRTKQLPSLNGWRAVSILLVLGSHLVMANGSPLRSYPLFVKFCDGSLGVRFFFTISGFLITWLMLKEEEASGSISLRNFYVRRALRILPVYVAYLIGLAVIQLFGIVVQDGYIWLKLLTFTRNFYIGNNAQPMISAHFWSLSVEEQFYLIWPVVFVLLGHSLRKRIGFLIGMLLLSLVWKIVVLLGWYNWHLWFAFGERSTFLYADCIANGCLAAILISARHSSLEWSVDKFPVSILLLAFVLIIGPEISGAGDCLQNFGFMLLLVHSVLRPDIASFKILNHPWMIRIGMLSYSLYVWHMLIFLFWPLPKLWLLSVPATFAVGWASYVVLERPFFSLRAKFRAQGTR